MMKTGYGNTFYEVHTPSNEHVISIPEHQSPAEKKEVYSR
jgi:hypothetical protein